MPNPLCKPYRRSRIGWAAAVLVVPLVLGVANAGGRGLAVSPVTVQVVGKGTVTSNPAGLDCGNGATTCYIAFSGSGTITLTATPATDWSFDSWTDCPVPVGNTCEVPVADAEHEVRANFAGPPTTTSTLSVTHSGSGNVSGGDIDCGSAPAGSDCSWTVLTGSTLTVRQTPGADNVFNGWGGACTGTSVACTVELTGDRAVSASWVGSAAVLLTVSVSGGGTVTGGGIDCPPTCTASQATNSTVVLTATAAGGHLFTGWSGACSGTASTCAVVMDDAKSVTATFAPVVQLTVGVNGNGNVTASGGTINCGDNGTICTANLPLDETVTLTATPAAGSTFGGWSGACGGSSTSCTILMNGSKSVTATFSPGAQLDVAVTGNGNVSGEAGAINCGNNATICSATFPLNRSVTLTATAATGSTFVGWSGACGGTSSACTILMSSAKSVRATFSGGTGNTVPLAVSVVGPGTVTGAGISCGSGASACSASVAVNSTVTLTATPGSGGSFAGWGGACGGSASTCTLSMTTAQNVSATFSGGTSTTVSLNVSVSGRGTVSASGISCGNGATACSTRLALNSSVTLTATPASGQTFAGWSGDCTGSATTCTLVMATGRSVSAAFRAATRRALTIRITGRGTVRTSAGRCTGGGARKTCVQRFAAGRRVVLTATPGTSARFGRWGGACRGTRRTCTVTLSSARTVTATFPPRRRASRR